MGKFTNLEVHLEPETTLFQQEVDVILAIIDQVLSNLEQYPTKGTFILDGQKMGEKAYNIVRFNLQDGYSTYHRYGRNSDRAAEESINEILSYPSSMNRYSTNPGYYWKSFGLLPSGFYQCDDMPQLRVVVINASFGRFIASFYGDPYDADTDCLTALAEALAQLCKEDKVLRRSVDDIVSDSVKRRDDGAEVAAAIASKMFDSCDHPALKAWRDWHESATKAGELTLFFE